MKIVSYIRVSTEKQGRSGLGLEAQQSAIDEYVETHAAEIMGSFVEVESGRNDNRPQLQAALKQAKLTGSRLLIAKLDRLSRNAAFLLNLQRAGVDFVACDNPTATPLTIGVLALVASEEADAASKRTIAALNAAKARGVKLGNPNGAAALRRAGKGNKAACDAQRLVADTRAADLREIIEGLEAEGFTTLTAKAQELNHRGIETARGGKWHASTVANLHKRYNQLPSVAQDYRNSEALFFR